MEMAGIALTQWDTLRDEGKAPNPSSADELDRWFDLSTYNLSELVSDVVYQKTLEEDLYMELGPGDHGFAVITEVVDLNFGKCFSIRVRGQFREDGEQALIIRTRKPEPYAHFQLLVNQGKIGGKQRLW